ncbi:YhgE/Pip family protein [Actinomadura yumaensis]|uniref:YhgE/Pip family protein n=1 Tax=Actinomadura yumaensis TaxID=111807 RepID=UPI00361DF173
MRALRLAAYELRRFRTPMQVAGLAFLALVPLLYGGIYLWSNWDPYDRIGELPVAVVNEDRPVRVQGRTVDAGGDFVRRLRSEHLVDMRETGAERARKGLREGTTTPSCPSRPTSARGSPAARSARRSRRPWRSR